MTRLGAAGLMAAVLGVALAGVACFSEHEPSAPDSGLTCARAAEPPGPDTVFVVIQGFAFQPANVTVSSGERVVWINCEASGTPGHTSTAVGGAWDSPTLQPGDVFSFVPAVGTWDYYCRVHPFMTGQLVVQ